MIFIDTGAFLARYLASDQHHVTAERAWREIAASGRPLATSNMVVAEFLTLLARRTTPVFAAERGRRLYESKAVTFLRPTELEESHAVLLLEQYAHEGVGFVDCVSFALIKSHNISEAFTFDRHFALAGVRLLPSV